MPSPKIIARVEDQHQHGSWEARLRADDSLIVDFFPCVQGEMFGRRVRYERTGLIGALDANLEQAVEQFVVEAPWTHVEHELRRGYPVE